MNDIGYIENENETINITNDLGTSIYPLSNALNYLTVFTWVNYNAHQVTLKKIKIKQAP